METQNNSRKRQRPEVEEEGNADNALLDSTAEKQQRKNPKEDNSDENGTETTTKTCNSISKEEGKLLTLLSETTATGSSSSSSTTGHHHGISNSSNMFPPCHFRLEAIFLPKFDNENKSDQRTRQTMRERVSSGLGFAEVTLKHSGSLLLWSGGRRFYSKNSANNQFTMVGEILLRQHFYRTALLLQQQKSQNNNISDNTNNNNNNNSVECMFETCSKFVEKQRLTLAFEVVSTVLGDHGAIPNRDYLILTAAADRSRCRHTHGDDDPFYSTFDLLRLAQQFFLPYNDTWVFASQTSLDGLLQFYDESRETGLANTTIEALTNVAETSIRSIYPHDIFHSNILEGFVIRYVSYKMPQQQQQQQQQSVKEQCLNSLTAISILSKDRLQQISPEAPPAYELARTLASLAKLPPVLTVDVRNVLTDVNEKTISPAPPSSSTNNNNADTTNLLPAVVEPSAGNPKSTMQQQEKADIPDASDSSGGDQTKILETRLRQILVESGPRPTVVHVTSASAQSLQGILPDFCERLLATTEGGGSAAGLCDQETEKIAIVIKTLSKLRARVNYAVFREEGEMATTARWLCMISIRFDKTFQKYKQEQKGNAGINNKMLDLFRGFCIEISVGDSNGSNNESDPTQTQPSIEEDASKLHNNGHAPNVASAETITKESEPESSYCDPLMLKMKMIPYMVRTFGCRNGVLIVKQGGTARFNEYAKELLTTRWQVSVKAVEKWMPYLQAWGEYVHCCLTSSSPTSQQIPVLAAPPLREDCYLQHLMRFEKLYYDEKFFASTSTSQDGSSDKAFKGLVIVLALDEQTAKRSAEYIAKDWLAGTKLLEGGVESITHESMVLYCTPSILGRVCWGSASTEKLGKIRKLPDQDKHHTSLLLVGCSESEIKAHCGKINDQRRLIGITMAWRKSRCGAVLDLPQAFSNPSQIDRDLVSETQRKLWSVSESIDDVDTRPGLLVFFAAAIPGCGKSTVLGSDTSRKLEDAIDGIIQSTSDSSNSMKKRKIAILSGDEQPRKLKFWKSIQEARLMDNSTISIADKNVPYATWEQVGQVCSATNARAVAVLPAQYGVFKTTHVDGARLPDGSDTLEKHHYPFSLHYLAVCMAHVMERNPGTHPGKLDPQEKYACMVVVKFFALYRGVSAEDFLDILKRKLAKVGALTVVNPVSLPFFDERSFQELPSELTDVLLEAIRAQRGWDSENIEYKKNSGGGYVDGLETRLRDCIRRHREYLTGFTVKEGVTRNLFVSGVVQRLLQVDGLTSLSGGFIKIVSLDIDPHNVHSVIRQYCKESDALNGKLSHDAFLDGQYQGSEYVVNTHVTMAHYNQLSQEKMRAMFEPILDKEVCLEVTGLLWNQRIAALRVNIAAHTQDGSAVPQSQNVFHHLTVWRCDEVSSAESNKLPQLLAAGEAREMLFPEGARLKGKLAFWGIN